MSEYKTYPAVDADYNFPPEIRRAIVDSPEASSTFLTRLVADAEYASQISLNNKISKNEIVVNVKDFGAVGDGFVDDTIAIQAALDHIRDSRGGVLWFPTGEFKVNGNVYLCSNVHITGSKGAVIRKTTGSTNYCVFVGLAGSSFGYGGGLSNIKLTGLTFRGNLGAGISLSAMSLHRASGVYVEDCSFLETSQNGHVFDLMGCEWVWINKSFFRGIKPVVGRGYTEAIQCDASTRNGLGFGMIDRAANEVFDGIGSRHIWVTNCEFTPFEVDGVTYPAQSPMGSHSYVDGKPHQYLHFINNTVRGVVTSKGDNYSGVVHFVGAQDVYIVDNDVDGSMISNTFVRFVSGTNATPLAEVNNPSPPLALAAKPIQPKNVYIRNNDIRNFVDDNVIWIYGNASDIIENIHTDDNTFRNCLTTGSSYIIQNTFLKHSSADNNRMIDCGYGGFYIADAYDMSVRRNKSNGGGWYPLNMARIDMPNVSDNTFVGHLREVLLSGATRPTIADNNVIVGRNGSGIIITAPLAGYGYIRVTGNEVRSTHTAVVSAEPGIGINVGYAKGLVANNICERYTVAVTAVSGLTMVNNVLV